MIPACIIALRMVAEVQELLVSELEEEADKIIFLDTKMAGDWDGAPPISRIWGASPSSWQACRQAPQSILLPIQYAFSKKTEALVCLKPIDMVVGMVRLRLNHCFSCTGWSHALPYSSAPELGSISSEAEHIPQMPAGHEFCIFIASRNAQFYGSINAMEQAVAASSAHDLD